MTNKTIYRLIKLVTLNPMTSFFDLNYYKDFNTTDQIHNSYPN